MTGSGVLGTAQSCGGDVWSTWAGQQPSHGDKRDQDQAEADSAYGFDGYQWLLNGSPISGATGPSYTPAVTAANLGQQLSCEATVTYTLFPITVSATGAAITLIAPTRCSDHADRTDEPEGVAAAGVFEAVRGSRRAGRAGDADQRRQRGCGSDNR